MFVHLVSRKEYLVLVRSLTKRTDINELSAEWFTNGSLSVRFIYSPSYIYKFRMILKLPISHRYPTAITDISNMSP
ncbi:hypothetical protein Hanom_Chr13g01191671 [Helianthus anomalus]